MALLVGLLILVLLVVPFALSLRRSNELFVVSVVRGRGVLKRGRAPQRLLDDINDVVRKPAVRSASVRVIQEGGRARVQIRGKLPEAQLQRLRNVVGAVPAAKIKAGGQPARKRRQRAHRR